uniref:Uncharacterized protein n=1 Tax=Arion vulgaris TaxID=1028688 RepID=A0A0B6ZJ76_9EUPU
MLYFLLTVKSKNIVLESLFEYINELFIEGTLFHNQKCHMCLARQSDKKSDR